MKNTVKIWLGPLFHLFFPRCCVVCGAPLVEGEEAICTHCNINMPRTNYHKVKDNLVERIFWGKDSFGTCHFLFLLSQRE